MNARQAREVAAVRFDAAEIVGQPAGAAMPRTRAADIVRCAARSARMARIRLEPLLPSIVAAFLASSVSAAEPGNGAGFFGAAVLVFAGPALGGLAVCAVMVGSRWAASKAPWVDLMASRRWSKRPKVFARADIASVLVPLIDHAGLQGRGTIQIVGSDGGYLTGAKKQGLTDAIRKWIAQGYDFRYILVAPSKEAVAELEALEEQVSRQDDTARERFEVLQLGGDAPDASASSSAPADIQRLERILRTCHPTLIWSEDRTRKAMWIEGNHPAGEDVSYNNRWVPPAAMCQAVADLPNQIWADVFSAWDGKLKRLCEYSRERMAIQ